MIVKIDQVKKKLIRKRLQEAAMELEHGFTTREEWEEYFIKFFTQIRELEEINLFQMNKEPQQWLMDFKEKSYVLEEKYRENNAYLKKHVYYFTREGYSWTKEIADPLLSFLYRYSTRFEDIEAAYELAQSLRVFYETLEDSVALMKCDMIVLNVYLFLDAVHLKGEILTICHRAIQIFEEHYEELNEEEKSMGMSFYDFQSVASSEYPDEAPFLSAQQIFEEYDNRMRMLRRFQKEADMELPLNQILPYFENCWTSNFLRILINTHERKRLHFTKKQMVFQLKLAEQLEEKASIENAVVTKVKYGTICLMLRYFLGEESAQIIYKKLLEFESRLPHKRVTTWEEYDDETIDSFNLIFKSFCILVNDEPQCKDGIQNIFSYLLDVYTHFPSNNYLECVADGFIYLYLIPALKYLENEQTLTALLRLTVYRQPQTLFHAVIVARCAKIVMREMIHQHPNTLLGILSCRTIEEVKDKEEELLGFIENSALLHDVGKILCTNVINMQYRKLNDIEFQVIKYHPVTSFEILQSVPALRKYAATAIGHHKSHDGTWGYPMEFDNIHTSEKILIDLVSICDSLDAATDYLGRSYAKNKTFHQVLKELQAGSGIRYSQKIVDIIGQSPSLQNELENLLFNEREKICLDMYTKMKSISI